MIIIVKKSYSIYNNRINAMAFAHYDNAQT